MPTETKENKLDLWMICGFLLVIMGQMFADSVGLREYSRSKHDQGVHVGASQT